MAGIKRVSSGAQTGADRAALDFAIEHGGWILPRPFNGAALSVPHER